MKELDLLLEGWLERGWPVADAPRREAFERLLERSDPELTAWLIGGRRPADGELSGLIDDIVRIRH